MPVLMGLPCQSVNPPIIPVASAKMQANGHREIVVLLTWAATTFPGSLLIRTMDTSGIKATVVMIALS